MATGTSKGGYDFEFVTAAPKSLECPVCLLTLRDPHVISCCGEEFCKRCIERVQRDGLPCPLCNEPNFITFLHKKLVREVNALMVRCPQKEQGCEWEGELGQVRQHLNPGAGNGQDVSKGCGFVMVACSHQCGAELPRRLLAEHEVDVCPKRPIEVQMTSLVLKFEAIVTENQLLRKELDDVKQTHREELDKMRQKCDELVKMTECQLATLKANTVPLIMPPVYMIMDNFKYLKSNRLAWVSDPFYSHPGGYKMVVKIYPYGIGAGGGTHMSAYVQLMRGEFDDELEWPFDGLVTIEAYNWTMNEWSVRTTIDLTKAKNDSGCICRPQMFRNYAKGCDRFISYGNLEHNYFKPTGLDSVSLRVSSVELVD